MEQPDVRQLAEAVIADDVEKVRAILKARPELVNMETENDERRPIHHAVFNRSVEMARVLMEAGADARKGIWPHRDATSAFTIANERGYNEIVAIILEAEGRRPEPVHDFDPNSWPQEMVEIAHSWDEDRMFAFLESHPEFINVPYYKMTPLHGAAARLMERSVIWLLDHGADVNFRDRNGPSPIELAGDVTDQPDPKRTAAVVSLLRSRGAEWTPRAAVAHGDTASARALLAAGKLFDRLPAAQGNRNLFEIAVAYRQTEMAELLLNLGFQLTPATAVLLGKGEWLRQQHAKGLLENPIGDEGGLISLAVRHDRGDMLALLLDLGLDPDERARVKGIEDVVYSAGAPLRECAQQGKLELAKILLEHGANPNAEVYASGSALFVAYGNKNWEMVRLLESHGGYLNAANAGYVRQTEVARKMLAGELDPRLEEGRYAGATLAEQLVWSGASGGDPEIVRMALEKIDWPRDDPRWFWILWRPLPGHEPWTSEDRPMFIECFRRILERCDPNLRAERFGQTMLHEVISRDHEDRATLARMLLDAGARMDFGDHLLKSTPLGWACRWGRIESVKLLLERGADPLETDAEPWASPRSWAEKAKRPDIVQLLNSRASA